MNQKSEPHMSRMTVEEAKEILARNVLKLPNAGLEYFPVKFVSINSFRISNTDENDRCMYAELIAMLDVVSNAPKFKMVSEGTHYCTAYFVYDGYDYYYRDFFFEAMDVINALRIVNDYRAKGQHPYM